MLPRLARSTATSSTASPGWRTPVATWDGIWRHDCEDRLHAKPARDEGQRLPHPARPQGRSGGEGEVRRQDVDGRDRGSAHPVREEEQVMDAQTITPHEFNLACDAFYEHPDDSALNEQGNRREK